MKASVKKTLGIIVTGFILFGGTVAIFKDAGQTPVVLGTWAGLAVAFFGLKGYYGIQAKKLENGCGDK